MTQQNDQLVLICGESATGKSASLENLKGDEGVLYLNCESGKKLPFRNKFTTKIIDDPYHIYEAFEYSKSSGQFDTIVIDTLTFLMDMFESKYVVGSENTMAGWQAYQQYFKNLMQQYVSVSTQNVIFTAHTRSDLNEKKMEMETAVPVKGALKNNGIEAYFSTVVATKKMSIKDLVGYENDMLNITEEDEMLGYKHVFQTRPTKLTTNERIRSPKGLFTIKETYMDNDAQLLLEHLRQYYS